VNPDTLRDLGQGIHDHDGTLLLDLIEKFLHGGDDITAGLTRAAAAGDVPQAHQLAHNLLSASTLMGAVPLADLLRLVQRVGVDEPAELVPLATQVQAEYRRVKATMHRLGTVGISSHDETDGDLASRADG
jgi:HPt (histidine-containing phosphotransfer) domain-containing protein